MNDEGLKIEKEIAERLREHLERIPNIKPISLRRNMRIAGSEVGVDAVVQVGDRQYEILVQVKSDGSPSVIRRAAGQLKAIRKSFPDDANLYLVVGAPYISNEGMQICKEEQVGCIVLQ